MLGGLKGASRSGPSRELQGGFKKLQEASRGLQGGFKVKGASRGLEGGTKGLEGGTKGA